MKTKLVPIKSIKTNPKNPRVIRDEKFQKLVKSIQEFPKMLDLRPIVVNKSMMVLGGNQRLKACIEAGLKEVPILIADELTKAEQERFIITDNVNFGDWDFSDLNANWNLESLENWGLDIDFGLEEEKVENHENKNINYNAIYILKINFQSEKELQKAYEKLKEEYECEIIM